MKAESITKLVSLLTDPKSSHRVLHDAGEFRLAGSSHLTGTYELVVKFEGDVMTMAGHAGRQYLTVTREEQMLNFKVLRRQGAYIKPDVQFPLTDVQDIYAWIHNWVNVEVAAEQ